MENPKKIISKLPSLNEQYGMERVPLDYDGGNGLEIAVDQYESGDFVRDGGNGLEIAVDQYESDDFVRDGGNGLEIAVDQYEGDDFVRDGGNGLEIAVDQYESGDFVRDGGNGLEIAVDQYESDDFVRDNWLDWTREPKEHENITNEPSDITNEGDSFDNNETVKIKKNKMISMLAAIAAAYFILK